LSRSIATNASIIVLVMGVSASGKTSFGGALARRLSFEFIDADELHPPANVQKMSRGIPLDDEDRRPWLDLVANRIEEWSRAGRRGVVACSALKRAYRQRLRAAHKDLILIYLHGERRLLEERMKSRHGHFMPTHLLDSQLATLEEPQPDEHAIRIAAADSLDHNVERAAAEIKRAVRRRPCRCVEGSGSEKF
jgi:gluconokinase